MEVKGLFWVHRYGSKPLLIPASRMEVKGRLLRFFDEDESLVAAFTKDCWSEAGRVVDGPHSDFDDDSVLEDD